MNMFGGLDPKKMQAMMKQMGIKNEEVDALRVVIEGSEKNIVIEPASVQKIIMQGQTTFQIAGEIREESKEEGIKQEDINLVMEKTGKSEEESKSALEKANGDIAEAIVSLS